MVSILLPVYNAQNTLSKCIDSIINQSFKNFELIIIDNNSTDLSSKIIQEYLKIETRIKLVFAKEQGISFALNNGLKISQFQYIARIDADDEMLPDRLQKQFDFLQTNPETDLISGLAKIDPNYCDVGFKKYIEQINSWKTETELFYHRFVESPFPHPSVMFRKKLIEKFGMYSNEDDVPEDFELWLRFYHNNVRMAKLNEEVVLWRDLPSRLTRNHPAYFIESFDKIRNRYIKMHIDKLKIKHPIIAIGDGKLARRKIKNMIKIGIPIVGMVGFEPNVHSFIPTFSYEQIPTAGDFFFISMVTNRGKFLEVRDFLEAKNYTIEKDFILAS